jgi:hypothetical protein
MPREIQVLKTGKQKLFGYFLGLVHCFATGRVIDYIYSRQARMFFPLPLCPSRRWSTPSWRNWLRHCTTSRKVAGSIPDGVIGIFH